MSTPDGSSFEVDVAEVNDPRAFVVAAIAAGRDVLELGSADSSVARSLGRSGCRVWKVVPVEDAGTDAAAYVDVVVGDLEQIDLKGALGRQVDVVIFIDVLEHLRDPIGVLRGSLDVLSDRGYVVLVLPNAAHPGMRERLRDQHGASADLLEQINQRFFDPSLVHQFLRDAGLVVLEEDQITAVDTATDADADVEAGEASYLFCFIVAPVGSGAAAEPPFLAARVLQRRLRSARQQVAELEAVVGVGGGIGRQAMVERLTYLVRASKERRRMLRTLAEAINEPPKD